MNLANVWHVCVLGHEGGWGLGWDGGLYEYNIYILGAYIYVNNYDNYKKVNKANLAISSTKLGVGVGVGGAIWNALWKILKELYYCNLVNDEETKRC